MLTLMGMALGHRLRKYKIKHIKFYTNTWNLDVFLYFSKIHIDQKLSWQFLIYCFYVIKHVRCH